MSKYSNINSWTHFDPLKQVVLGNVYEPKFFDDLPDDSIRQSIQKVLTWEEDFHIYPGHGDKTTLKSEIYTLRQWEQSI